MVVVVAAGVVVVVDVVVVVAAGVVVVAAGVVVVAAGVVVVVDVVVVVTAEVVVVGNTGEAIPRAVSLTVVPPRVIIPFVSCAEATPLLNPITVPSASP